MSNDQPKRLVTPSLLQPMKTPAKRPLHRLRRRRRDRLAEDGEATVRDGAANQAAHPDDHLAEHDHHCGE